MGKPDPEQLQALCPDVDAALVRAHLDRLDDRYFQVFGTSAVAGHIQALAQLSSDEPAAVEVSDLGGGKVEITVASANLPGLFAILSGVMFSFGFSIRSGDVFTYRPATEPTRRPPHRPGRRRRPVAVAERRKIIDRFQGRVAEGTDFDPWAQSLRQTLVELIAMLAGRDAEKVRAAKSRVNELVTARLSRDVAPLEALLWPVRIDIDQKDGAFTRLRVVAEDTPAFLYTLCSALSEHDLSFEQIRIRTFEDHLEDVIDVVDSSGQPIRDAATLDRITLSVLLTKQFTYFLSLAPDPFTALTRFETLTTDILESDQREQWLALLANPHCMRDLARLLGASDYLWEDFVRLRRDQLLTLLQPRPGGRRIVESSKTIATRLQEALADTRPEDRPAVVNRFKDQEIFLIDLDHLLTPGSNFQTFSRRLTRLAEAVVQASAELAFTGLVAEHGAPRTADGHPAPWAVFGLGKLGGRALGYASDIELLFVYDGPGQTDGKQPMDNAQFFQRLVNDTTHLVRAKREGIFEVDLRLRPHGKDGPLASSADAFERYFAPQGPRHEMERLALVRLRAIGGDAKLGRRIEAARDQLLYDTNGLDLGALREIRHRAYEEKATGPTFNAKQGCGGLLDMESSVQMMQIRFGGDHPAVRGPYIHAAVKALGEAGALDAHEAAAMIQAYEFLRRLINGLRMLRGNATDLSLPSDQSPQYRHLARRIGYTRRPDLPSSQQLEFDLAQHTATVRCFVARHLGRDLLLKSAKLNLADLVLSDDLGPAEHQAILAPLKFRDTTAAAEKLSAMAGAAKQRRVFARLAVQAGDLIAAETDRDRTLDRWAQVVSRLPDPLAHYRVLLEDHRRLGVVIALLGRSPAVTDLLTRLPQLVQWIASPEHLLDPDHLAAIDRALQIQGVSP